MSVYRSRPHRQNSYVTNTDRVNSPAVARKLRLRELGPRELWVRLICRTQTRVCVSPAFGVANLESVPLVCY